MPKQIYNTRGLSLEQIKEILQSKKQNASQHYNSLLSKLKEEISSVEYQILKNNREIEYLEKFISKKEKQANKNKKKTILK